MPMQTIVTKQQRTTGLDGARAPIYNSARSVATIGPNPEYVRFVAAMRRARRLAAPWSGVVYRATSPHYASSRDLVSGEGARLHGGRWNAPGTFAAVYASLDPQTAMAE